MANAAVRIVRRLEGSRPAIVRDGVATPARDLRHRVLGLAAALQAEGVRPDDRVLLLVAPGADLAATLLALVWIGAVPVLLDPQQAPGAWEARVTAAAPAFAVVDPRLRWAWRLPLLPRLLRRRGVALPPKPRGTRVLPLPAPLATEPDPSPRRERDEALILFTSGTTGAPKAVIHDHGSLAAFLDRVAGVVHGLEVSSYLAETPQQIFYALLLDATAHVVSGQGERRVRKTIDLLATGRVTAWFGSSWTWVRWLDEGRPIPPSLRTVLLGSAPVTRPFLRRLLPKLPAAATVRGVYGLTEAGPVCTVDGREKAEGDHPGDWVGRPVPGVELRLRDDRVWVRSDAVPPGSRLDGWLDTGDLGRLEDDGLQLLGRAKDMILRRGINLYPGVLEPLLLPHCQDAALIGVYDHQAEDERVVLVTAGPPPPDPAGLLGDAAPDHVLTLDALPRGGRQHKVDKDALRALARARFSIP